MPKSGRTTLRILLVEDDEAHAELIRRSFEASRQPLELFPAPTLREAQAALAGRGFDLVIVDLRLPDGDGTALLPGDREQASLPVIVMTSHGDEQVAVEAMKTGALDYVVKSKEAFASMPLIAERALQSFSLIVERRQAEEHLRESEGRLRLALDAARMGAWEWDVRNRRLTWTEGVEAILGVGKGEFGGTPEALMALIHPDDRETVARVMSETFAGRRSEFHFEHRVVAPGGAVRWIEAKGRAASDGEGTTLVQGTLADVTPRKVAEEALRDRERLAAIGTLVAGVAHEVRTPLFSMSATLDACEGQLSKPRVQQELVSRLRSQVQRLSNLMSDLLDYARPPRLELASGGVDDIVRRAVRSCAALAEQAGVRVCEDLARDLPNVNRDAGRLEQVLQNLLANALQHAPRASCVRVTARPVAVPRRGITLAIEDEGPGLDEDDLARVFEPWFTRRKGGTGLGLSIVRRIVQEHGGDVAVANGPGGGAVFSVFLPQAEVGLPTNRQP